MQVPLIDYVYKYDSLIKSVRMKDKIAVIELVEKVGRQVVLKMYIVLV